MRSTHLSSDETKWSVIDLYDFEPMNNNMFHIMSLCHSNMWTALPILLVRLFLMIELANIFRFLQIIIFALLLLKTVTVVAYFEV